MAERAIGPVPARHKSERMAPPPLRRPSEAWNLATPGKRVSPHLRVAAAVVA